MLGMWYSVCLGLLVRHWRLSSVVENLPTMPKGEAMAVAIAQSPLEGSGGMAQQ